MSDQTISEGDDDFRAQRQQMPDFASRSRWLFRLLPVILFLAVGITAAVEYWDFISTKGNGYIPLVFSVALSVLLSMLPAMICVVQNTTRQRQLNRLNALRQFPVRGTTYYRTALTVVDRMRTGSVDADFEAPLFIYFLTIFCGFMCFFIAYDLRLTFETPSVFLGGLHPPKATDFETYQTGTFRVMGVAFVAAYIYSLGRLLDRVNNNDLYPISLYYYAVRVVIACATAAILRHTADVANLEGNAVLLVAFAIGFAPDLFIVAMSRRAFQAMKTWGTRDDPASANRPTSLPLMMIDDLSREKIDRLNELGIDNAHVLARQNPFLLLPRLPYDLGLLVDWIGQAQLYVLVKDSKLSALRAILVRDIFDLNIRLRCEAARPAVCAAMGRDEAETPAILKQLEQDPTFARLSEVRTALVQKTGH